MKYYSSTAPIHGPLVAASEHAVMCMGGKEGEKETIIRLIKEAKKRGHTILSLVCDTWDLWKVCTVTLNDPELQAVLKESGIKLVIRPDSGDPVHILTGYKWSGVDYKDRDQAINASYEPHEWHSEVMMIDGKFYRYNGETMPFVVDIEEKEMSLAEKEGVVKLLYDAFGGTTNSLGYIQLASCIGTIYGDSISLERAEKICSRLDDMGFASTNWVAGIGSYTYQYVTRDTFGMAIKATYGEVVRTFTATEEAPKEWEEAFKDGIKVTEGREIFKDPITDSGEKKSKCGMCAVFEGSEGKLFVLDRQTKEQEKTGELLTVFLNSKMVREYSLDQIRAKVKASDGVPTTKTVLQAI